MWRAILVLACGCRQLWGLGGTPGLEGDAAIDTPSDGMRADVADSALCFGHFLDQPYCLDALPTGDVTLVAAIDTTADPSCDAAFTSACVVVANTITVNALVRGSGPRPLVLLGTTAVTIANSGSIDVGSHGFVGAGGDLAGCNANGVADNSGGGSGGSFGGAGGDGGMGAGNGAAAGATIPLASLRGGCPGGPGTGGTNFGNGGFGGGAIYLIAGAVLTINGNIDASGRGGEGSPATNGGGGGGGSGGLIILDAPAITINAGQVFANGGGGGGGAGTVSGMNGDDPSNTGRANGGTGGNSAARGGRGSGTDILDGDVGQNSPSAAGGGGGGGGAGFIKVLGGGTLNNQAPFSPPPT